MNSSDLLSSLFSAGQQMLSQGKQVGESALGVPEQGGERDAMLSGMGKGALITGLASLLLGTKTGRQVAGTGFNIASIAGLGTLAYKAYSNWQSSQQGQSAAATAPLIESNNEVRSQILLRAMIAAAKADGHIDENEQQAINSQLAQLGENDSELQNFIQSEINKPLDPVGFAAEIQDPTLAGEVYLLSKMIIDDENFMEKAYFTELTKNLPIDDNLIAHLEQQASS